MKKMMALLLCLALLLPVPVYAGGSAERSLAMAVYRDKVRAGWLGKMVGVSTGILREFWYRGEMAPESAVPKWTPALLSLASIEDDLYIPYVLLQQLDAHGIDMTGREMAIALYPYSFEFWNGHLYTFESGIAPPDAGHPAYAPFPDGLSYSFAADYSGLIAPGRPDIPMALADRFGAMLVYGDGIYGGAYIGALYSEAFFTDDREAIVARALDAVPEESWLHEAIADVLAQYRKDPGDWTQAWEAITQKYFLRMDYNWIAWPYGGRTGGINLDAKLNCAYATIALLYGEGDIEQTLSLAIRCGQDCDSNAANVLGVLFTILGWDGIPDTYKEGLETFPNFRYADDSFDALVSLTERVARETLLEAGARIEPGEGGEWLHIPAPALVPGPARSSKKPEPLAESLFTEDEMLRMVKPALADGGFEEDWHETVYPPWMVTGSGQSGIDVRKGKAYEGDNNAWLSVGSGERIELSQHRIRVTPGQTYALTCAVRTDSGFDAGWLRAQCAGERGAVLGETAFGAAADYTDITLMFDTGQAQVIDIQIGHASGGNASWLQIDDVRLVQVP